MPQALCVAYVTLVWASREAEVLLMLVGQTGCEALNFVMKRIIKEERPKQMFGKGYGMPSSHAQFVTFFSVYLTLFLLLRHTFISGFMARATLALALYLGAIGVAISRIYLNYHTPRQVLAGCVAGAVCAFAWFFVTDFLRTHGWVDWMLDSSVAQKLRVRDLVVNEDFAEGGWQRWKAKRKLNHADDSTSMMPSSKSD